MDEFERDLQYNSQFYTNSYRLNSENSEDMPQTERR